MRKSIFSPPWPVKAAVAIENARTYQRLEELEQAKSDFVFTVAHELKSPVAAIQSILRVLLEGYAGEIFQKQKELIDRAERRLIALQSLIRDLLALGALKGALPEAQEDRRDFERDRQPGRGRGPARGGRERVGLQVEVPDTLVTIKANEDDLERLLGNLLENAVKYTPPTGKVQPGAQLEATRSASWSRTRASGLRRNPWPASSRNSTGPRMPRRWGRKARAWACPWSNISWTATTGRSAWKASSSREALSRSPFPENNP